MTDFRCYGFFTVSFGSIFATTKSNPATKAVRAAREFVEFGY